MHGAFLFVDAATCAGGSHTASNASCAHCSPTCRGLMGAMGTPPAACTSSCMAGSMASACTLALWLYWPLVMAG